MDRTGSTTKKILLLLMAGVALGFSGNPKRYGRILKETSKAWENINTEVLRRNIKNLYESKLIEYKEHKDGTVEIVLSERGMKRALRYNLDTMVIPKPKEWDKKWRVTLFDIPEKKKALRNALRTNFKQLGLKELQKSVFVHPYACRDEIDFIIELYDARRYVRFIEAHDIDNEFHLRKKFKLS